MNPKFKIASIALQSFDDQLVILENECARVEVHLKAGYHVDKDDAPDEIDFNPQQVDNAFGVVAYAKLESELKASVANADQLKSDLDKAAENAVQLLAEIDKLKAAPKKAKSKVKKKKV